MSPFTAAQVRRYYDRQTSAFVALGQGGREGVIHRAVWGPGVADRAAAFHYVENRIADLIRHRLNTLEAPRVIDLGCGIGASLCYLAERTPIHGTGVTLSPVQAALGAERVREHGLSDRVQCLEGDYGALPPSVASADLAYAIESFVHAPSPERFFAECSRIIRPGGVLAICDDVRRPTTEPAAAAALEQFCRGWHVNSLLETGDLLGLARAAGFEHDSTVDLSSYLEIDRPRDRFVRMLLPLVGRLPLDRTPFAHLVGGCALQTCLRRGWIGYELIVLQRTRGG